MYVLVMLALNLYKLLLLCICLVGCIKIVYIELKNYLHCTLHYYSGKDVKQKFWGVNWVFNWVDVCIKIIVEKNLSTLDVYIKSMQRVLLCDLIKLNEL